MLDEAISFVKQTGTTYLAKELVKVRATDCLVQIRKCILEMAADLEPFELKQACDIKDLNLIQIVGKALED